MGFFVAKKLKKIVKEKPQKTIRLLKPQPGPQTKFLESSADIVFYGGQAGGGKTFALLLESLRFKNNETLKGVIFRKTIEDAMGEGGIWSDSESIFPSFGASSNLQKKKWTFPNNKKLTSKNSKTVRKEKYKPSGATISFSGLQYEKDKYRFQGRQFGFIFFDELTHFSQSQFFYLLSRLRLGTGAYGIRPYCRATLNPDPDSWVAKFISWWIDDAGFAIPERSGIIRWFIRDGNSILWFDSEEEAKKAFPKRQAMSFTFIHSSLKDNPALLEKDPDYISKLEALPPVDRARLLGGNWKIRASKGDYYKRELIPIIKELPQDIEIITRYFDRAATEESADNPNPDWTSGTLFYRTKNKKYGWADQKRFRKRPGDVLESIKEIASADLERWGYKYILALEQDPGSAGKAEIDYLVKELAGFNIKIVKKTNDKVTNQKPLSSQVQIKNVSMLEGDWNNDLLEELEAFPEGGHDDQVDSSGGAFLIVSLNQVAKAEEIKAKDTIKDYRSKMR